MPNKVALRRRDNDELLELMSYTLDEKGLAVEIIYLESAGHSNANLLRTNILGLPKRSLPMRRLCLLRLVLGVSCFSRQRPLMPLGSYDPFRLIIWEDAAEHIIAEYQ